MNSEMLRTEKALFTVEFSPLPSSLNRSFDEASAFLGVFLRADGNLWIEEWEATIHPRTGLPFFKVATIHAAVNRRKLSTLACGNPEAPLGSLHAAMMALGRGNQAGLLDEIAGCSEDSATNDHRYPPTRIDLWPRSAERKFAANLVRTTSDQKR